MAVGWQRWRGPYPAIDTRTGPALLASAGPCWLTFSAYSTDSEIMLSLTMSGAESSPSATVARAMARVDEVTILMSGSRCLCCHWGLSMVTGVTVCVHWLTENTTLTRDWCSERERERERVAARDTVAGDQRPGRVSLHQ